MKVKIYLNSILFIYFLLTSLVLIGQNRNSNEFKYSNCIREVSFWGIDGTDKINVSLDPTLSSPNNGIYDKPHYLNNELLCDINFGAEKKPVAYISGKNPKVSAKLELNCGMNEIWISGEVKSQLSGNHYYPSIKITKSSDGYYYYKKSNLEYAEAVIANNTTLYNFPLNMVRFFDPYEITWRISNTNEPLQSSKWLEIGKSENPLYILRSTPLLYFENNLGYYTLIHTACKYANGLSDQNEIVDAIYEKFKTKSIERISDGHILTYWMDGAPSNGFCVSLLALIQTGNGQCGAWQEFFQFCGGIHGIHIEDWTIVNNSLVNLTSLNDEIKKFNLGNFTILTNYIRLIGAKNWNTGESYIYLGISHPTNPFIDNIIFNPDSGGLLGESGQGNSNPRSLFENHAICRFNGFYYDPSYGSTKQSSQNQHESQAFDITRGIIFSVNIDSNGNFFNPPKIYLYLKGLNNSQQQLKYSHP